MTYRASAEGSIVCWGDSLTYGTLDGDTSDANPTYPQTLAARLGVPVKNFGVGGFGSAQVATKAGALQPLLTLSGGKIPAGTTYPSPISVTAISPTDGWHYSAGSGNLDIFGTLAGVAGIFRQDLSTLAFSFVPFAAPPSDVTVAAGTPFICSDGAAFRNRTAIIWVGANNDRSNTTAAIRDITSIANYLTSAGRKFYVISATSASANMLTFNTAIKAAFPAQFIDVRNYMITSALSDAGITPTGNDTSDIAAGYIPRSFRPANGTHLTQTAYNLIGNYVADVITGRKVDPATFPTLNQSTTGSAATLTTGRTVQTSLSSTSSATFDGSANVTPGVTGTLAVGNGGTGQTTAAAAITALTGTQTAGLYLRSNGTNSALAAIVAADVPTLNQSTTGSAATLTTGRTVQTSLSSTSSETFDGSANVTPGVTGTLAVANGGTGATTLTGLIKGSGTSALAAATAGTDYADITTDVFADALTTGESTILRRQVIAANVPSTSGYCRFTFFTARKTETITQIRTISGATAAATSTLCRVGIYSVDGSGNLTLIASIANDTALWAATNTAYTRSLSASFTKTRGNRYAVGLIFVGTTAPSFAGINTGFAASEFGIGPRLGAITSGNSDLPASVAVGSLTDTSTQSYTVLLP